MATELQASQPPRWITEIVTPVGEGQERIVVYHDQGAGMRPKMVRDEIIPCLRTCQTQREWLRLEDERVQRERREQEDWEIAQLLKRLPPREREIYQIIVDDILNYCEEGGSWYEDSRRAIEATRKITKLWSGVHG